MRIIKFRGRWRDTSKIIPDFNEEYVFGACNDECFIVDQFTGLKDKNGKEIYEGDIVSQSGWCSGEIAEVYWSEDCCGFRIMTSFGVPVVPDLKEHSSIVIGNIYENPELLNKDVVVCPECKGIGGFETEEEGITCPQCNGSGSMGSNLFSALCDSCGGVGKVKKDDE